MAGRTLEQTPAVKGASRAHIECDINVDSLAYWNDPQGTRDQEFESPFAVQVRFFFLASLVVHCHASQHSLTNVFLSLSLFVEQDDTKYITFAPDKGGWNNVRMVRFFFFISVNCKLVDLQIKWRSHFFSINNILVHGDHLCHCRYYWADSGTPTESTAISVARKFLPLFPQSLKSSAIVAHICLHFLLAWKWTDTSWFWRFFPFGNS